MGEMRLSFRCARCAKSSNNPMERGRVTSGHGYVARLTGRTKPNKSRRRGTRASKLSREYKCEDCGHVGWSSHKDLELARFDA